MSRNDPTEVLVAVHFDHPKRAAVLISIDGENSRGVWVPRAHLKSFHLTGQTTLGTDQQGNRVTLAMANIEIPEWLAQREGLI